MCSTQGPTLLKPKVTFASGRAQKLKFQACSVCYSLSLVVAFALSPYLLPTPTLILINVGHAKMKEHYSGRVRHK